MAIGSARYPYPILHPCPAPFLGEFCFPCPRPIGYPPRSNMIFHFLFLFFHSFWLNYMKQKNSISMTTIDLVVNQFATNQFTSINLHETTIHT